MVSEGDIIEYEDALDSRSARHFVGEVAKVKHDDGQLVIDVDRRFDGDNVDIEVINMDDPAINEDYEPEDYE